MGEQRLLDRYDALLLDLDGTVYRGRLALPGAVHSVDTARAAGLTVRFVTNNASRAPAEVAAHLLAVGVAAAADEVNTSAQAAGSVLGERLPPGSSVLVVGTEALAAEVVDAGLVPVRTAEPTLPAAVVQGMSPDACWRDLAEACVAIRAGALWVACNVDPTLPTERGELPGNGAMVAAVRTATGVEPVIAGKPATPLMAESVRSANADRPLVIGDRLDTDIAGAVASGLPALLVLTGITTPALLLHAGRDERPTYLAADLTAVTARPSELEIAARPQWTVEPDDGRLLVRYTGQGDGAAAEDPLDLLRALCAAHWSTGGGPVQVGPADTHAAVAVRALGLGTDRLA